MTYYRHLYSTEAETYGQATAASNLVAGGNLEATIQSILEMGGGTWERATVLRALRAAFNNPERAVEYLYSVRRYPQFTQVTIAVNISCLAYSTLHKATK